MGKRGRTFMAEGSSERSIEPAVPSKACMMVSANSSYLHTSGGAAVRCLPLMLASQPCPASNRQAGMLPVRGSRNLCRLHARCDSGAAPNTPNTSWAPGWSLPRQTPPLRLVLQGAAASASHKGSPGSSIHELQQLQELQGASGSFRELQEFQGLQELQEPGAPPAQVAQRAEHHVGAQQAGQAQLPQQEGQVPGPQGVQLALSSPQGLPHGCTEPGACWEGTCAGCQGCHEAGRGGAEGCSGSGPLCHSLRRP